ncbi:MAG: glycosyltransferase family 4 protein [Acidobacteria bacterium]|nr:glycosyltransferase family 4 protein [Acidobacteriota bacterium]MBV9476254.1 glycosyltransferase family 4 protein [Acidobacteriota bacterium]
MRVGIDARKIADFGIGTYIRGLLRGLVALERGDTYVAFAPADAALPDGVEHVVVDAPHYSVRELLVVGRAAERAGVDVLHAPHYVVPFTRLPVVVTIHDLIHLHQPLHPLARVYARTMLRRAVRKAARVLTVSESVRLQLERELGAREVVVTPNGVDVPAGVASPGRDFLFVGNDKPHKNVGTLVEAFAHVRRELPDVRLVLAGAPFARFAHVDGVVARGRVSDDELFALYRGALALVMPSREEGFGLPAAEAMACGTAVITSLAPALVEVTGDAALHADARGAHVLADAMLRVARDASLRAQLAARGVARARVFTWKRCAERTAEAYEEARKRGTSWNNG